MIFLAQSMEPFGDIYLTMNLLLTLECIKLQHLAQKMINETYGNGAETPFSFHKGLRKEIWYLRGLNVDVF